jgi:release factor glutamine methyltransferase
VKLKEFLKTQTQSVNPNLKLELEYLIRETLNITRLEFHDGQIQLTDENKNILIQGIKELKEEVPLAYILKSQDFMGLNFYVDSRVLIPRPETEYLVDLCLKTLKSLVCNSYGKVEELNILDSGAGSGCIGISILVFNPNAKCIFIEKSEDAIEVLKINLIKHNINSSRYQIFKSFEEFERNNKDFKNSLDLFISNPPYIASHDQQVESSVLKYEPSIALFAEDEGLYYLKNWSLKAIEYLKSGTGFALFEFGQGQENILQSYGNLMTMKTEIIEDQYQKPRFWKIFT